MQYLSKEAHKGEVSGILFLMPCHSTPYYSSLHYNVTMRFLDCTPRYVVLLTIQISSGLLDLILLQKRFLGLILICC